MLIAFFGIGTLIAVLNGNWGAAAVGGLIVAAIVFMINEDKADEKAHRNRRDYWAYGREPDWKRKQRLEKEQAQKWTLESDQNTFRCNSCGRTFQGTKVYAKTSEGKLIYNVTCPVCGRSSWRFEK